MDNRFFLIAAFFAIIYPLQHAKAQDSNDSLAFVSANWNWQKIGNGAKAGYAQFRIFGSTQSISIVKYPARKFRTQIINSPGNIANTTDSLAMKYASLVAINGSFFNTKTLYPHTFLSINHKIEGISSAHEYRRSNGILAFKDRKGRKMDIFLCDTSSYAKYSKKYYYAIAAGPLLLLDGKNAHIDTNMEFNSTRHPRSIIGYDNNGYYYMIVIDGRFPGQGEGISIPEAVAVARYAGLKEAINLDGGGSSTLWTEPTGVINHPCDNKKFDHAGCRIVPNLIIAR